MSFTTTSEIAGPVSVVFQQTLLRNAKARAPYFAGSTAAEIREHSGTFTAKWRRIENLSAVTTALSELTGGVAFPTRVGVQPSVTDYTATLAKYGNFIFLNEEVDLINYNGQTDKLVEILGINAGQSLNRLQRNELEDNLTAVVAGTATTATAVYSSLTLNAIRGAVNTLQRNSALKFRPQTTGSTNIGTTPVRQSYWGLCHVDVEENVRQLSGFNSVETYASQTEIADGEFGAVGGVRWVSSEDATIDAGSGATATGSTTGLDLRQTGGVVDRYSSVVLGMDCHGSVGLGFEHIKEVYMAGDTLPGVQMIMKPKGSAGSADPYNEVATMAWKSWHAAEILNANWGRVIASGATIY